MANANDDSIFLHKYYKLINKFEIFVKLLQINFIACINVNYQKHKYLKTFNEGDFLVNFLSH